MKETETKQSEKKKIYNGRKYLGPVDKVSY